MHFILLSQVRTNQGSSSAQEDSTAHQEQVKTKSRARWEATATASAFQKNDSAFHVTQDPTAPNWISQPPAETAVAGIIVCLGRIPQPLNWPTWLIVQLRTVIWALATGARVDITARQEAKLSMVRSLNLIALFNFTKKRFQFYLQLLINFAFGH